MERSKLPSLSMMKINQVIKSSYRRNRSVRCSCGAQSGGRGIDVQ
jgi:hypothetical protein